MHLNHERFHNLLDFGLPTLTRLIQPVFAQSSVIAAQPLTDGHINTNFKLRLSDRAEPIVLRIYRRGPEVCRKERELYSLLANRVPMAEMVWADYSQTSFEWSYSIMSWVEGLPLHQVLSTGGPDDNEQAGQSVGATLAAIGAFDFERAGFFGPDLTIARPFGDGTLADYVKLHLFDQHGAAKLGDELAQQLWQLIEANSIILEGLPKTTSLVHADYSLGNILMQPGATGWQVAAVLDWEWAHVWTSLFDMAVLFRHDEALPPGFVTAFQQGFTGHGGLLPPDWWHCVKLLDLINLAEFLSRPNQLDVQADCVRVIRRMLAEW